MYTPSKIKTGLFGLIGFRNPKDPDIPDLDSTLTSSISGMYYDDFHPLLVTNNIEQIAPNFDAENYASYVAATAYAVGDRVIYNEIAYQSKTAANTGNTPVSSPTNWKTMLSVWLEEKENASNIKMVDRMFTNKKMNESTKAIFENRQIFDGAGRLGDTITPNGRFVGLEIRFLRANNLKLILDYIGLQFTAAQTDLTFYLFHSSRETVIATKQFTTTGTNDFQWKDPVSANVNSLTMSYVNYADNIDSGGSWYFGYFEDDISGNAIRKEYDFVNAPCLGCPGTEYNYTSYNLWSKYIQIQPIEVASTDLNGTDLWDISKNSYPQTTNFGLNLSMSLRPDVSELVISNKNVLTNVLGQQFAVDMLLEMAHNADVRTNPNEQNAQQKVILYELDGSSETNRRGLIKELDDSIKGAAEDFSKLSTVLPKNKPSRIKFGAM